MATMHITALPLRIGYVPEHFSTPLHFAQEHFLLSARLIPFPSGTGHMIVSLAANEIDVAIGLTEGWVAGLAKHLASYTNSSEKAPYKIVGTYVETPLCWAISTGANRPDITSVDVLCGKKMGVSRIGSGSYVMGYVLADTHHWLQPGSTGSTGSKDNEPFNVVPLQTFAALRSAVNDRTADFFMWEHFTSKRYHDSGDITRIGEIYTPWPSWHIVARDPGDERLPGMFEALDKGVEYFGENQEEAVSYISSKLDYSEQDARDWLGTVKFPKDVKGVDEDVVEKTIGVLQKAGVVGEGIQASTMIGIQRTR